MSCVIFIDTIWRTVGDTSAGKMRTFSRFLVCVLRMCLTQCASGVEKTEEEKNGFSLKPPSTV